MSILRLAWQNALRWRFRLITIALLIGLACSLFLLYSGMIANSIAMGKARISPLETHYFDMLLLLEEDQQAIALDDLPRPRFNRQIVEEMQAVKIAQLATPYGDIRSLGLPSGSPFYAFAPGDLQGRLASEGSLDEVLLPRSWAKRCQLSIGDVLYLSHIGWGPADLHASIEVKVVGIYEDDGYPLALLSSAAMDKLLWDVEANALLLQLLPGAELAHLDEWMSSVYPGAVQISSGLPQILGATMLAQAYNPGNFILVMLFLFLGIGVLTIALMTFLERRREVAALKSIGITNRQTVFLFGFEYSLAEIMGLLFTWAAASFGLSGLPWFAGLGSAELNLMVLQVALISTVVLVIGLIYPILIAKVATVNQLHFARTIPISIRDFDYMLSPTGDLLLREEEDQVRIIRVPYDGRYMCMLFKSIGDQVKRGEVIASEETYEGHFITNFRSICDGTVIELNGSVVVVKADNENEPRHAYPGNLVQEERHRRDLLERVRAEERQMRETGSSSTEEKLKQTGRSMREF